MTHGIDFVSVIVTTYNRPDALRLVLLGLNQQTASNFEVLVADDGSTDETRDMIEALKPQLSYTLQHMWQEDKGFRAARARNLAVAASKGNYLIFLDGDCIPFPEFVSTHQWLAEQGWFISGNRMHLSEKFTAKVLTSDLTVTQWNLGQWLAARLMGQVKRVIPLFHFRSQKFRKIRKNNWYGAKTCNLTIAALFGAIRQRELS